MFKKRNYIGIDFNTNTTQIYVRKLGIIYNEPTLLCSNANFSEVYCGNETKKLMDNNDFICINPIIDVNIEIFLLYFEVILKFLKTRKLLKNSTLYLSYPIDLYEEETSLIRTFLSSYRINDVEFYDPLYLIALSFKHQITNNSTLMIIYISAMTSTITIFEDNHFKIKEDLFYCGDYIDERIKQYIMYKHNLNISLEIAKDIKTKISSVNPTINKKYTLPNNNIEITSDEIYPIIIEVVNNLAKNIIKFTDLLSTSTLKNINESGIILAGGFHKIDGLVPYIKEKFNLNFVISDNPSNDIINGLRILIQTKSTYKNYV